MEPPAATELDLKLLREGKPPCSLELLRYLEVPNPGWSDFLRREYLEDFIAHGGTKVKFLIGTQGTGKSHLLSLIAGTAREAGYLAASLNAYGSRLFPIDRLYGAIVRAVDPDTVEQAYARRVVENLGFDYPDASLRRTFLEHAVREAWGTEATLRRSLREGIDALTRDPELDPTFAVATALGVGHRLGLFHLSEPERDALRRWFQGDKVKLAELRPLQIYEGVDRYTARDYLRSLARLARLAGFQGLLVCVDNTETVAHRSAVTGEQRYTRLQRDEAYETIRQLIDDVDRSHGMLFLFAGRRELLEDEKAGISSYEALRLRLLQEVRAARFNPYADIVDLNQARASGYVSPEALSEWLSRVREYETAAPRGESVPNTQLSLRDLVISLGTE